MKRYLPFALMFVSVGLVYACSSSDETTPTPDGGASSTSSSTSSTSSSGGEGGSDAPTDSPTDAPVTNVNPIEGVTATAVAALAGVTVEGPVWRGDSFFFSDYGSAKIVKFTPPSTTAIVRDATPMASPLGSYFDEKNSTFVTAEAVFQQQQGFIVRTPANGGNGTPIALTFVTDAGATNFDQPNDLVVRKSDGTIYVTDPGYGIDVGLIKNNHIWRIAVTGAGGATGTAYETAVQNRPNGIAFSPDEKSLYVSFTDTGVISKYVVNTDGTLGATSDFATVPGGKDALIDGLAVDSAGNVYAAVKDGVEVYKPNGQKWGKLASGNKAIGSLAFGGADKKTLFLGAFGGTSMTATVKVAGK